MSNTTEGERMEPMSPHGLQLEQEPESTATVEAEAEAIDDPGRERRPPEPVVAAEAPTGTGVTAAEPAEPRSPPPPVGFEEALAGLEQRVAMELARLREQFEDRFALDRFKETQIERLHDELQTHKQDLLARINRPLLMGLIRLHNDLGRTVSGLRCRPADEQTAERFLRAFDGVGDDVELLLEQHGVERFESSEPAFDPTRQTVLRTVETADAGLVGGVAGRVRPGFSHGTTLLQREGVAVYIAGAPTGDPGVTGDPAAEHNPGGNRE